MTIGEFPDSWKIAHITPIPKVNSPSSSSEYRPISVLTVLSKLFEKVLNHRVYSYLTEHNLIDKRQYGFNLHMSNSCFHVLQATVKFEMCKIDNRLRANKLSLNYNKTNFMLLNSQKHNPTSFKVIVKRLQSSNQT